MLGSRRRQTPVLMRQIFPIIAACLFGCRPRIPGDLDYYEKCNCCNAERDQSPGRLRTGRVSGFGFPYGRMVLTSGFGRTSWLRIPALRLQPSSSDLRSRPYGPPAPALRAPGSGLVSVLSGGMSPVFRPGQARRRKSIDTDCRVCARILFLGIQLAGLCFVRAVPSNAKVVIGPPGAQQGRLFAPPTTVEPSLIARW